MAVQSLKVATERIIRPEVARKAPTPETEAFLLSYGRTSDGRMVGVPYGRRFFRTGGQMTVQQAIAQEKARVSGDIITLGHCAELNRLTMFSWQRRRRPAQKGETWEVSGEILSTAPFHFRWLQQLEYGGVGEWRIEPRAGRKRLYPKDGVWATAMTKTVRPREMYQKGFLASLAQLKKFLAQDITKRMK